MLELEQLHEELDVGQRAAPELQVELRVLAGRDPLALDARLHAPDLTPVVVGEGLAVHDVVDEVSRSAPEVGVAGHDARLRQRLPFPRERPPLVVGRVAVEGTRERALVALGAEPRVDAEGLTFRGGRADLGDELLRESLGDVEVGGSGSPS